VQPRVIGSAICVSPATLARRANAGCFKTAESDRLIALIVVFQEAVALFEGDVSAASGWMKTSVCGLGKRPLDMMETRIETDAVLDLLGRLENGVVV
jgi:putative toxin-antitoxin system antitoxin component (TIGR02293 family)